MENNSVKKNVLVKNASILMIATIISRIIGLLYRRPLGEVLGTVGLGYYGYASNLYSILLLVSSYSIPMAVSKIISEKLAKKEYKNSHRVFKSALIYALIAGGAAALLALFGGGFLIPANQQNAVPALRALAPTILLSAFLGVLRGYFQAHHNMTPTSISQIAEQIMNAIVSVVAAVILINVMAPNGGTDQAIWGAVGGTIGTGAGVATGLIIMLFIYKLNSDTIGRRIKRDQHPRIMSYKQALVILLLFMTPIILTTFINNASTYIDSYLYAGLQGMHSIDPDAISSAYGEFSNYFIPVINIPLALASASAAAMMPEVSEAYALEDYKRANTHINQTMKLTMFICVPAMVGLMVLAVPIMGLLFPASTELSAKLLIVGGVYVFFTAVSTVSSCVLLAIGRQRQAMINAAIALAANVAILAILLLLIPSLDIYAVVIASIIFSAAYGVINMLQIRVLLGYRNNWRKVYIYPLLASALMGVVCLLIYKGLTEVTRRPTIGLIVAVVVGVLVYLIFYVLISRTSKEEMLTYPMGRRLVVLLRKLRIYR